MSQLQFFPAIVLEMCPLPLLLGLWISTMACWAKPYLHRIFCRLIWVLVQVLSCGLFAYYVWNLVTTFLLNHWSGFVTHIYSYPNRFSLHAAASFDDSHQLMYIVVCFVSGCLFVGAIWFITQLYGGLAGKPSAKIIEGSTVHSATLNDLTALITATLQPYKNQQLATSTTPTISDISIITQQVLSELQPLIATTIRQSLSEIPALSSLVASVPSANFVANLVEGVQVDIENLYDSINDVRHLLITPASNAAIHSLPLQPKNSTQIVHDPIEHDPEINNSQVNESKHVRWADICNSDKEDPTVSTMVAMTPKAGTKVRKFTPMTPHRPIPGKSLPPELPEEFSKLTEGELLEKLKERQAQRQVERRAPYYLTEEEKNMSMDALHRAWKIERQRQNNEREELSRHDFAELGDLTAEQKELPRAAIRRIIRQRKNEVWATAMKARGIPVFQCDVCYELTTGNHRCIATKWTTDNSKNSAISKGIVMTQGPSGIRLQTKAIIDQEKLNKEYEQLRILREDLEAKAKLVQPLKPAISDTAMLIDSSVPSAGTDPPRV